MFEEILSLAKAYIDKRLKQNASSGACLPVVELITQPTTEGAPLTEAEAQAVLSAGESPVVLKFNIDSEGGWLRVAALANHVIASDTGFRVYEASLNVVPVLASVAIAPDGTALFAFEDLSREE